VATTKKPPKVGRPKLPKAAAKSYLLKVRLNASENQTIEDASERALGASRKKSEWARKVLLTEAEKTALKKAD
jgi:hypothetical protein